MKTGKLETPVNFLLGSDADGDIYYRNAGVLTRLPKGAANQKLFMNAAGTAPEWGVGIKMTAHTYNLSTASGTQTLTGVGFLPKYLNISYGVNMVLAGIGQTDGTLVALQNIQEASAFSNRIDTWLMYAIVTPGNTQLVTGFQFNADGGVITWSKTGSPTGTLIMHATWFR